MAGLTSRGRAGRMIAGPPARSMNTVFDQALGSEFDLLAAEERQRLLSRLLAQLAHEIRNPLSSLHIHAQLLEEDVHRMDAATREKLQSRLELIHGELHRLENIVKRFLRLSGPSQLSLEPLELSRVVDHVCDLLRPEAAERGIEISAQLDPLPRPLMADSPQLTQALMNLIINALQAVDRNGRVEVRARLLENHVVLSVSDTGPGIPSGGHVSIFEPYYTTKPGGTGLGLWIVQQIAMAHQGVVHAANNPAGGAVFTLRLPLEPRPL